MYVILSPAKTLDFEPTKQKIKTSAPVFEQETKEIVGAAKKLSIKDIEKLMGVSEKIATLNFDRFRNFYKQDTKPALFAFQGDVYKGLDAETLTQKEIDYAADHLGILSGLYGLLRAGDLMYPYRLEMGLGFPVGKHKNLYHFWGEKIAEQINLNMKKVKATHLVNLASNEYGDAVKRDILDKPVVDIVFKDGKKGQIPKVIGIHAKKARGLMARAILENRWQDIKDLKKFDSEGYVFDKTNSDDKTFTFVRINP